MIADRKIDTCSDGKLGTTLAAADAKRRYPGIGNCYLTLVVNGPVYTGELVLDRTAGATHGAGPQTGEEAENVLKRYYGAVGSKQIDPYLGAGTPGEIFNMRADAYLWAYNQAQRYSEAVVTYMRELAPRY